MEPEKKQFDPDGPGIANGNYFGLPFTPDESELVLLPVPWEVTTSYGTGTENGPQAMLDASLQIDLYDPICPEGWKRGIATLEPNRRWAREGRKLRRKARKVMSRLERGADPDSAVLRRLTEAVNEGSHRLNDGVEAAARHWLADGKRVGLLGGDHSAPLGLIRAAAARHPGLGILHVDAHADLREAYEGFTYSHASIMYNVLQEVPDAAKLVQVGVRDQGREEFLRARGDKRVQQYTDAELAAARFGGETWEALCKKIVAHLPAEVYVSFDIDGLTPDHCPATGTPVPGGLTFNEAVHLLHVLTASGRRIVSFDLCEVGGGEWDANVGARMLYKLCNFTLLSSGS